MHKSDNRHVATNGNGTTRGITLILLGIVTSAAVGMAAHWGARASHRIDDHQDRIIMLEARIEALERASGVNNDPTAD